MVLTIFGYCTAGLFLVLILFVVLVQNVLGNQHLLDRPLKLMCRLIPLCFGCRVQVLGVENAQTGRACVFIANHVNIFDPLVLYGYIPRFFRGVELEDHFSWPVWGTITRRMGNVPISHRNVRRAHESLEKAAVLLESGTSIAILPEGHRTRDGQLGEFMRGPFRLALSVHADVVPVAMKGAFERKNVHSMRVRPGRMQLLVGPRIAAEDVSTYTDRELLVAVRQSIEALLS